MPFTNALFLMPRYNELNEPGFSPLHVSVALPVHAFPATRQVPVTGDPASWVTAYRGPPLMVSAAAFEATPNTASTPQATTSIAVRQRALPRRTHENAFIAGRPVRTDPRTVTLELFVPAFLIEFASPSQHCPIQSLNPR